MLGVVTYDEDDPADQLLKEYAEHLGFGDTYGKTRVGVFLGEPGKTVPDPFFGGEGPTAPAACAAGAAWSAAARRQEHAAQELPLVRRARGATIHAERRSSTSARSGRRRREGYEVVTERRGLVPQAPPDVTARGVVLSAGALGTNRLLQRCR
jgi:cholesterol oxidase